MADPKQDLDVFLTAIESKLRGPFSSLELAKAVQTASLRRRLPGGSNNENNSHSEADYLDGLSQVLHRTDKITQLRILVGLLGLEYSSKRGGNDDTSQRLSDQCIDRILTQAQEAPVYEEWVRVVAGLVQGIMFDDVSDDAEQQQQEQVEARSATCRGKEANDLLEKMCQTIIDSVGQVDQRAMATGSSVVSAEEETADADPTLAPFRYALLHSDLLHQVIPETKSHSHFQIDKTASILHMDAKLDRSKAQEEKEHNTSLVGQRASKGAATNTTGSSQTKTTTPTFPGFRSTKTAATTTKARPKSSMFLTTKKPNTATRTALHTRKQGAAQALVGKGRSRLLAGKGGGPSGTASSSLGTNRSTVRGRALNTTTARSRMKMIDVQEVRGLAAEQKEKEGKATDTAASSSSRKKTLLVGQKRKAAGASMGEPTAKKATATGGEDGVRSNARPPAASAQRTAPSKAVPHTTAANATAGALASAALSAYQAQVAATNRTKPVATAKAETAHTTPATKQQDWRQMLEEKSNRLSSEDRFRIQQFFNDKYNPTPDQPTYKMKLHEQRTTDPKTGEPVKETFYLELDYTSFTSKQSKKIKRYTKDAS